MEEQPYKQEIYDCEADRKMFFFLIQTLENDQFGE